MRVNRMLGVGALLVGLLAASPAHALYLFFLRRDLERLVREEPGQIVGKQVTFTDELMVLWPQAVERPNSLSGKRYTLFDTRYFHCAVPEGSEGEHLEGLRQVVAENLAPALAALERVNDAVHEGTLGQAEAQQQRTKLWWDLYELWANRPIVTVFGTAQRADFWGPVKGGAATERVTIVVDRVERPRDRWYFHGLDDQDQPD